jgi:ABC-type multidrug transport system ATPase subunit
MTAVESVSFYASIVLPPDMPKEVRKARIARVLRMMGLSHAQNTLVGGCSLQLTRFGQFLPD